MLWSVFGVSVLLLIAAAYLLSTTGQSPIATGILAAGAVGAAICLALVPGAIARSRRLPNSSAVNMLGVLGLLIPPLWLIALILALVMTAPPPIKAAKAAEE